MDYLYLWIFPHSWGRDLETGWSLWVGNPFFLGRSACAASALPQLMDGPFWPWASLACKALQPFSLIMGMMSLNNKERTCPWSGREHV